MVPELGFDPGSRGAPADHRIGVHLRQNLRVGVPVPRPIVRNSGPLGSSHRPRRRDRRLGILEGVVVGNRGRPRWRASVPDSPALGTAPSWASCEFGGAPDAVGCCCVLCDAARCVGHNRVTTDCRSTSYVIDIISPSDVPPPDRESGCTALGTRSPVRGRGSASSAVWSQSTLAGLTVSAIGSLLMSRSTGFTSSMPTGFAGSRINDAVRPYRPATSWVTYPTRHCYPVDTR